MIYLKAYIGALITLLILDAIWIGLVAKNLYEAELHQQMRESPNWPAAALFYLFYVGGVVFFAVMPSLRSGDWTSAALYGAILGLLAYGTYAMTSYAMFKGWTLPLAVSDLLWGGVLTAAAAVGGHLAARWNT